MKNNVKNLVKGVVGIGVGTGGAWLVNTVVTEAIPEPVKMAMTISSGIVVGHGLEKTLNGVIDLVTIPRKKEEKKND